MTISAFGLDHSTIDGHDYISFSKYNGGGGLTHSASCKMCIAGKKQEIIIKKQEIKLLADILKELKKD